MIIFDEADEMFKQIESTYLKISELIKAISNCENKNV